MSNMYTLLKNIHGDNAWCVFTTLISILLKLGKYESGCKRFLDSGMTPEQVAERMDVPMKFVNACM